MLPRVRLRTIHSDRRSVVIPRNGEFPWTTANLTVLDHASHVFRCDEDFHIFPAERTIHAHHFTHLSRDRSTTIQRAGRQSTVFGLLCLRRMTTILLAGATGLVGDAVLHLLLENDRANRVIALLRKPITTRASKLEQWMASGPLISGMRDEHVDAVICCLGTTLADVGGDKEKFAAIDRDLVVALASWAKHHQVHSIAIVSAVGADPKSSIFYTRTKGEMEQAVAALEIPATHFLQPSSLVGPRTTRRIGERIGITLNQIAAPFLVGTARRYRPMPHGVLARAVVQTALDRRAGLWRHTFDGIVELASVASRPENQNES